MNHIGDTNKMVDTPRMDASAHDDGAIWQTGCNIERELNAANDRIKRLEDWILRLEDWKESALAVEREWDANAISTMLGGKPGESQRKVIQREVPRLLDRIKRLEQAGDDLASWSPSITHSNNWRKAKEAKP